MTSPVGTIVSDGDVIFTVGEEKRQLRVYSLFLRTVSGVFNAMLGPRYNEGTSLSPDIPKLIPLPEDDPETMEIIFGIIHFRQDIVIDQLEPEAVYRLAIAIEKYDMAQALEVYTRGWLDCDKIQNPGSLWQLAKAAYLLHNDRAFETATLGLLYYYKEPYIHLRNIDATAIDLSDQFIAMMEEHRARLRLEVVCRAARSELQAKGKRPVPSNKLDPVRISTSSLNDNIISLLKPLTNEGDFEFGTLDNGNEFNTPDYKNEFVRVTIEEFVAKGLGGLCLTCVRTREDHKSHSS